MAEIIARTVDAPPLSWTCLVTEDGDLYAAFVHGHRSLYEVRADAEDGMREGFAAHGYPDKVLDEHFGEGVDVWHFWMRPYGPEGTDPAEQTFIECKSDAHGAFPVTGARFE